MSLAAAILARIRFKPAPGTIRISCDPGVPINDALKQTQDWSSTDSPAFFEKAGAVASGTRIVNVYLDTVY